jgi:RNA-directed DNA polymerase
MQSITHYLTTQLRLKVNASKSAVARPWERKFLGFSFANHAVPRRVIAPKALQRFRERVRAQTRRNRGVSLLRMIADLAPYLRGWRGYFGFSQLASVWRDLDSWVRRRLRSVAWHQWRTGQRRFAELRARNVRRDLAARTAGSPHGPWRISRSPALNYALPNGYFDALGLPQLAARPRA